jgi:hypothetical protein
MRNQWEVKWWRVGLVLAIIFVTIYATGIIWEQYADWREINVFLRENPNLANVPIPLPDKSVANLDGSRLELVGLSMQVPWKEIWRRWDFKTVSTVSFKDGPGLDIFDLSRAMVMERAIQSHTKDKQEVEAERRLVGSHALNCCHDLMASELTVKPSELRWWNTFLTRHRTLVRLERKSMDIGDSNAIFEISAGEMRGFQMGNPAAAPYGVTLELFDRNDRRHEIRISQYRANHPFLTQAEVNAIVASIRTVPIN